jgi:FADH2 O2-dependent halogenase
VVSATGSRFLARFVVDASGFRSPLADKFGLREEPSRLRHHSRSIFTHMINVTPVEDLYPPGAHGTPDKLSEGTLHHIFRGGWLWVIPFNNHPRATNPLVSVGLQVDPRIHPKPEGLTPEQEFYQFIADYPDIAAQFQGARAVREWVSTGRLQYSPRQTVGYRYCLTSHAAGFIDPLFSRGMSNTFEIINALGWRLLAALREDDFDPARFAYVQRLEQGQLDFNDNLVANAYTSFGNYELWDAWCRVWALGQILATMEINRAYARFLSTHDVAGLAHLETLAPDGALPAYQPLRQLYARVSDEVRAVQDRGRDASLAAKTIMSLLAEADFVPPFGLDDPDCRCYNGTFTVARQSLRWAKTRAPAEIGKLVHEGLTLFIRHRLDRREYNLPEELRYAIAARPVLGKRLRVPSPR